jgi:phosphoribosyl-ATP pyrophosphohydrolase
LFHVRQNNNACHLDRYSCFGDREFSLEHLYKVIKERIDNSSEKSYTSRIAEEDKNITDKILEEAEEVVNSTDQANLIWEVADLTCFVMVLMAKKGITISDIKKELWSRRK